MRQACGNIYKIARKQAGLTQEKAAELLHIGERTLGAYETSEVVPPGDVVCSMCELYGAPWLGYMHLQQTDPVGKKFLPEIDFSNLPTSVLRFQKEMADISKVSTDIIEVACDGMVEETEKNRWEKAMQEVTEGIAAGFEMLFSATKKAVA